MFSFRPKKADNNDKALLELYRSTGDQQHLSELYERYMHLVYGVCLKYLQDRELAKDAVMQIYEILVEEVLKHEIEQFRGWLYVLARNHCLMELRKVKKQHFISIHTEENHPGIMEIAEPVHPNGEADEHEKDLLRLKECIEQLKADQKECVRRFYLEEKSYAQIHEEMKMEMKKVKSHIQNGRRNLKICMEEHKLRIGGKDAK